MLKRDKVICGIDLGSSKFKAVVSLVDGRGNFYRFEHVEAKNSGVRGGVVTDISKATLVLKQLIAKLENKINRKIKRVYVNIGGKDLVFRNANAVTPLTDRGNKVVTQADINLVNSYARSLNVKLGEEIIHDFAYRYILDDHNQVLNPKGLYGHKIAADLYLAVSSINHIENIAKLINQAGLEIESLVFSGLASSLAVLDKKQKEEGCVLVDIGADLTHLLIFKDANLRFCDVLAYGGNNITSGICDVLNLPRNLAEEIKDAYGSAISQDIDAEEEVMIKKDDSYQPIRRRVISSVIEPEVTQLLTRLKEKIDSSSYLSGRGYSVIITGGSSLLDGLLELAESVLGVSVKLGIPKVEGFRGKNLLKSSNRAVGFASAIGLLHYGLDMTKSNKFTIFRSKDTNLLTYISARLKGIYSDYF